MAKNKLITENRSNLSLAVSVFVGRSNGFSSAAQSQRAAARPTPKALTKARLNGASKPCKAQQCDETTHGE